MTWQILTGDCIEQMRILDDESIDAVVCDPPYNLSDSGKRDSHCLRRILLEVDLPDDEQRDLQTSQGAALPRPGGGRPTLGRKDGAVGVSAEVGVPEGAVDLEGPAVIEQEVDDGNEASIFAPDRDLAAVPDGVATEDLGDYILQAADGRHSPFCDSTCSCFTEPRPGHVAVAVVVTGPAGRHLAGDDIGRGRTGNTHVRPGDDPRRESKGATPILAGWGAEARAVLRLDLRGGAHELRPADRADEHAPLFLLSPADGIGASARAGRLASVSEPHRVSVIRDSAVRTLTLQAPWHALKPSRQTGGFMGKTWDGWESPASFQRWCRAWAAEAFRILRPGGHLLAFGGSRTYHRLAAGVEDAGFEIRDQIQFLYGTGFPKSLDVSKAIDKAADYRLKATVRRAAVAAVEAAGLELPGNSRHDWTVGEHAPGDQWWAEFQRWLPTLSDDDRERVERETTETVRKTAGWFTSRDLYELSAPATPEAEQWDGWGTALKPAHEPIVVARKPLIGTVSQNVLEHGTGGINVAGCKVGSESTERKRTDDDFGLINDDGWVPTPGTNGSADGRWPANVVLDEDWEPILCLRNTLDSDAWEILSEWCDARSSDVPRVRGRDRRAAEPGESPEILLAAVPASVDVEESSRRRSPDDGPEAPAGVDREDEGEPQIGDRSRESELEGVVPESGLPVHQPAGRPGGAGAPVGDGTRVGATADGRGDRSPHQRSENGQPTGEPGGSPAGRPHSPSRRHLSGAARAARAGREVLLRDVPAPWLKHFEFTGDVAAVGAAAMLDEQTGESVSRKGEPRAGANGNGWGMTATGAEYDDRGGASRFFYCAKTSRAERNAGLEGFEEREHRRYGEQGQGSTPQQTPRVAQVAANHHPTVKPINLMRWLVRLVTPPGGTVLDPFTGSGSTGCAAVLEGLDFIGCEREEEYVAIAEARIAFWAKHVGREVEDVLGLVAASSRHRERHEHHGTLFDLAAEEAA